ncbi:MAG: M20/M25/M40 family metallo-hydrolase, partial [Halobacteriota archaeon]
GEASHGSRPMLGENAIDRLYVAIERIRSIVGQRTPVLPTSVEPIVEESVAYYEAIMGADAARALFTTPTINLGTIHGGEAINTVPESARARLDIRTPPGVAPETILEDLRDCVDSCEGIVIADVSWSTGSYDAIDSPIVEAVASVAAAVTGERIYRRSGTGGGDAKAARRAGIETVEFALGTETAHAVDEYTTLDALRLNAQIYARLPWVYADLRGR